MLWRPKPSFMDHPFNSKLFKDPIRFVSLMKNYYLKWIRANHVPEFWAKSVKNKFLESQLIFHWFAFQDCSPRRNNTYMNKHVTFLIADDGTSALLLVGSYYNIFFWHLKNLKSLVYRSMSPLYNHRILWKCWPWCFLTVHYNYCLPSLSSAKSFSTILFI